MLSVKIVRGSPFAIAPIQYIIIRQNISKTSAHQSGGAPPGQTCLNRYKIESLNSPIKDERL